MAGQEYAVEMRGVSKCFGGIPAVSDADLTIKKGTIHGLMGENGAGKSTLMKILCGIIRMDAGKILLEGSEAKIRSLIEAQAHRIAIVPQELALVEYFTVAENIFLGREQTGAAKLVSRKKMNAEAKTLLETLHISLNPGQLVSELSVSEKQMLVIAKVLSLDAEVVIMDEPTARLGVQEIRDFLEYMKYLRSIGKTIIYISHKLEEIFEICDEVTVLRDGRVIACHRVAEITVDMLIREMVNRSAETLDIQKKKKPREEIILSAEHLSASSQVRDVSFSLYKGEILGFYGLVGAGRTESIRAMLGIDRLKGGTVIYKGNEVRFNTIRDSMDAGIVLVPEERRQQGLVMNLPIYQNTTLPKLKTYARRGILNGRKEIADAKRIGEELAMACSSVKAPAGSLSGGNQQKVVLSKFLEMPVDIFIFDEPTRGIDVGAKSEIYTLIEQISEQGTSVIIISSEIPEIQSICDRVAVMREGRVVKILEEDEFKDAETILKYSIGG